MESVKIRETFLNFFKSKSHHIVPSAPMVVKGDPTLMFINSGMAPFKDVFLGNSPITHKRIADTQKCLRVSGKHNDLEEVGVDTYHHTMFEMLGNWSFGDYFKKEAITWSWELLTEVYKLPKDRLYVTVFEGDEKENIPRSTEALACWKELVPEHHIVFGNKKDNFWEMGETGPCGPCTEIHFDGRNDEERAKTPGELFVNKDHPEVIEIWNNVFMMFNRMKDGSLQALPLRHVDTGMGFERLVRVIQNKKSNYDTDIFQPIIKHVEKLSGLNYELHNPKVSAQQEKLNIAMRVIADHIRTVSFSIADGQLPSNTGAGYVIRRILRRAIRYGYQSLQIREPFMYQLVETLANQMGGAFPEILQQKKIIEKVIKEEETSFFKTLASGLNRLENICAQTVAQKQNIIAGNVVFELYDTYGFPLDLTSLIARENNLSIDENAFNDALQEQKSRSRAATTIDSGDWIVLQNTDKVAFVGYQTDTCETQIIKYRKVKSKNKDQYQLVLNQTPFYAESGGQVGDTGFLKSLNDTIEIIDTRKENNLIIHITDSICENLNQTFTASINTLKRSFTENNHSTTHLLHAALRNILGTHVEQKGSLVNPEHLRFDFSHFEKINDTQIIAIEELVNQKIRDNILVDTQNMSINKAKETGAMALFGEKYGSDVRVVTIDKNYSIELCGGTHVKHTGQIGVFKIIHESAVAAGIRRIEAYTAEKAQIYFNEQLHILNEVKHALKNPKDVLKSIQSLHDENHQLSKQLNELITEKIKLTKASVTDKIKNINDHLHVITQVDLPTNEAVKELLFQLKNQYNNLFALVAVVINNKPNLHLLISDELIKSKNWNASQIIRELAKEIQGGGGGQAFYASAGGNEVKGIEKSFAKALSIIS